MVSFCYYLLRGDTVVPSGLLARLCHAFLIVSVLMSLYVQLNQLRHGTLLL